ncbi:MAG: D-alanyl-D-alanine carboxypeptidase family protein [Pseudomonadota bacterium]
MVSILLKSSVVYVFNLEAGVLTRRKFLAGLSAFVALLAINDRLFRGQRSSQTGETPTSGTQSHEQLTAKRNSTLQELTSHNAMAHPNDSRITRRWGRQHSSANTEPQENHHPSPDRPNSKQETFASSDQTFENSDFDQLFIRDHFNFAEENVVPVAPEFVLDDQRRVTMESTFQRLTRLQNQVGYGNFNVIGWDDALRFAKQYSAVGEFTRTELEFVDELFSQNASTLGFYGDKVITHLSSRINKSEIKKIPGTGHYLFKGESIKMYESIRKDIGDTVVLTSGIRSVVKQIYLFINKAREVDGNLSVASFSLAPPGHSYHAVGDFDVGKIGFGKRNFTADFADTDEFKRLSELGYFDIRYPQNNPFGVRYEPWHIKVV